MSPCPVPYSHFCRVRRRASTQLFFGNTLLAARLFAGSSRAKSGFPSRGKLTWQACSTILVSSLSCGLHPPSSAPPWNGLPLSTFRCTKLSKLYSELITPRAAGLWLSAGTHTRSSAGGGLPPRRQQSHERTRAGGSRLAQRLAVPDGRLGIRVHRRSSGEFSRRAWIRHSRKRMPQAGQF